VHPNTEPMSLASVIARAAISVLLIAAMIAATVLWPEYITGALVLGPTLALIWFIWRWRRQDYS
jgi:hypothetical protein